VSDTTTRSQNLGTKLQSLPRQWLYLLLIICATVPLFFTVKLPDQPEESSTDLFANLMNLKPGDKVLIGTDWTNGTRAESAGEMEALLRILIRKGVKMAVYSTGDPQSPQVFRDTMANIAADEAKHGEPLYKPFDDYVVCGYFPNSEGQTLAINNNVRAAFAGKTDHAPNGPPTDVLQSPVFQDVKSVSDFKFLVLVSPSNTDTITLERVKKTPLMFMVTGVMVPTDQPYYASGQLKGLCPGIKGVFDLEHLMAVGLKQGESSKWGAIPGWPDKTNEGRGTKYYFALHVCLALLILAVLVGNIGMYLSKKVAR
jgi:hypothetical protein